MTENLENKDTILVSINNFYGKYETAVPKLWILFVHVKGNSKKIIFENFVFVWISHNFANLKLAGNTKISVHRTKDKHFVYEIRTKVSTWTIHWLGIIDIHCSSTQAACLILWHEHLNNQNRTYALHTNTFKHLSTTHAHIL